MSYTLPTLDEILTLGKLIDINHQNEDPERIKLAAILAKISDLIETLSQSETTNKEELRASLVGAYMYCLEAIGEKYYLHSPEFKNGYIYNSGSPLYSALANVLKINTTNPVTARERLIYINKFH